MANDSISGPHLNNVFVSCTENPNQHPIEKIAFVFMAVAKLAFANLRVRNIKTNEPTNQRGIQHKN